MRTPRDPEVPQSEVADCTVIGAVRQSLGESADVSMQDMVIDSVEGVVRLTGTVDALSEKQAAGRIARNTPGVKQVENDLVVTSTKLLEDEELLEAVEEALGDFPPSDPARIGVRMVEDGIVYLTGKATSALEARQAANVASRVPGVKGIVSEIDIAPSEPVSDIDIRNGVADALSDDTRVDAFQVEISVEDGEVRLDGFVEDEDQVRLASEIAAGVPGVKRVTNRLRGRNE